MESILEFFSQVDFQANVFIEYAVILPILLLIIMILVFVVTTRRRYVINKREKTVRHLLVAVQAGHIFDAENREEMLTRLLPEEQETRGIKSSLMKILEFALKLARFDKEETRKRLLRAGHRDSDAMSKYVMRRGIAMFIVPTVLWIFLPVLNIEGLLAFGVCLIGAFAGGIVIDARLDSEVKANQDAMNTELPVLLDLLSIHLEAGSSFDVALGRISQSLKVSFPVAALEIFYLRTELETSVDREATFRNFADRIGSQTAKTFVAIIIQSEKRGNAVVGALRRTAQDARRDVMTDTEKKSQKIPTVMQLPMFMFILPAIIMSVIGPAVIRVLIEVAKL